MSLERVKRTPDIYKQEIIEVLLFHELARVQRYPVPLTVMRMGVQHNRAPSPAVTESVNLIVTHILNANLRVADVAGHYENDYLMILPVSEEVGSAAVARRLTRLLYGTHPFRNGSQIEIITFTGLVTIAQGAPISAIECLDQVVAALTEARRRAPGSIVIYSQMGKTGPLK